VGFNADVVRLAQIFENNGAYAAVDIIDSSMMRYAQQALDDENDQAPAEEDYAKLLDNSMRTNYPVVEPQQDIWPRHSSESFWVYPDGSVMLLRQNSIQRH